MTAYLEAFASATSISIRWVAGSRPWRGNDLADEASEQEINAIFDKVRGGTRLAPAEMVRFKAAMLHEWAVMDHEKGWTQQFHIGALRSNNSRQFEALGPDTGFDSILDGCIARRLSKFLDRLEREDRLAKTILYNLNPNMNDLLATMLGNFQDGRTPANAVRQRLVVFGPERRHGKATRALSNQGLLSLFVGMLTDSRSFLSYTRHEYFRRILCNLLGTEMEQGILPADFEMIGQMVRDISYNNAAGYFGFDLETR